MEDLLHEIVSMPHVEAFTLRWDAEKRLYTWEAQVRGERYGNAAEVMGPADLKLQARTILLVARHTLRMLSDACRLVEG